MACCSKRRKAATQEVPLAGADGFVLVEYRGTQHNLAMPSRTTDALYVFSPGTQRYIDAYDLGMMVLHRDNGADVQVFFEVDG
jgi:hypothetical protein